jgi:hypothetical protein
MIVAIPVGEALVKAISGLVIMGLLGFGLWIVLSHRTSPEQCQSPAFYYEDSHIDDCRAAYDKDCGEVDAKFTASYRGGGRPPDDVFQAWAVCYVKWSVAGDASDAILGLANNYRPPLPLPSFSPPLATPCSYGGTHWGDICH